MRFLIVLVVIAVSVTLFLYHPKFGRKPGAGRLSKIQQASNYKDGQFQNEHFTPDLAEGATYYKVFTKFFFGKSKTNAPKNPLPSVKTDLKNLNPNENILVWFGHSSYFIQADGKTMLVDPVFSGSASPISFTTKAFAGSDAYTTDDLPEIDYLFITHDHWDHLDYETVLKLKTKVKKVITGLGTGEHLERWGYDPKIIKEGNWHDELVLDNGFVVNITPGRHFSGRGLKRNTALWVSFVLQTPSFKMFLGGDSGYDTHFKAIGNAFGPFDLALLECGQYNEYWKYIHMMPEEVVTAAQDLKAQNLMPVHWAKFSLSVHSWDEPIKRVTKEAEKQNMPTTTPMIGEKVNLNAIGKKYDHWWEGLE
ncbi:MBL fold metallo-hydrolase [Flavobacterium sp. Sd200]|uniref:MBL fold metallo-hydrolase n=1 Tax=Flavobacterium sp. Sd200 TaxID=2692211 RepID=UPI00136D301F|nr:MBL fold metallo-hydrolase [Flavobacterium sp. Sd200]MXN92661.1 MBL fold metallo-hydrolase [Flavobacterium sp. Sd200]